MRYAIHRIQNVTISRYRVLNLNHGKIDRNPCAHTTVNQGLFGSQPATGILISHRFRAAIIVRDVSAIGQRPHGYTASPARIRRACNGLPRRMPFAGSNVALQDAESQSPILPVMPCENAAGARHDIAATMDNADLMATII